MISIILLLICFTILLVKYCVKTSDYWKKRNNTKQVKGVLWTFVTGNRSLSEILKEIYDTNQNLPQVGFFLGINPALIIRNIKNVEAVLQGDFQSFYARGLTTNSTDLLTDNLLFTEDYNRWKLLRHKESLAFAKKKLRAMFYSIEKCTREFIESTEKDPRSLKDPFNTIYSYVTDCISATTFGVDKKTRAHMDISFEELASLSVKPTLKFNLKFALLNLSPKLYKLLNIKLLGNYEYFWIKFTRELLKEYRENGTNNMDYINYLLKLQDRGVIRDYVTDYKTDATLQLLAAQAFVFVLGGIESTANTIHYIFLELSNNPKVLQKLHEEIDEIFEKDKFQFEDIDKFEYMEKVINEAMRKYPPVGTIQRKCCKDTVLPIGEVTIEKDTIVFIPIYAIHRDEKYFPNPDVFDPERFSPENLSRIPKYSFMPFGGGYRNCIGIRMARIEIKVAVAWILRKYTLKEQCYTPDHFEPSFFSLRDPKASYEFLPRRSKDYSS